MGRVRNVERTRRASVRRGSVGRGASAGLIAIALVAAACSSSSGPSSTSSSRTLRTAFSFDQGSLDPDIFYDAEGLAITLSVYEGLVQYKPDSTQIEPLLAKSYSVSSDGLTYTFHLRPNVKFHDGTSFNSAAAKFDFERRLKVNGGPSYMVADVTSMDTPDPLTFIVHLKQPLTPFLDYLASPYGPKMMSPTEIKKHEVKNDLGQDWLKSHDAGTGPYELTSVTPGQLYVMKSFPDYWGPKPYYTSVQITQIPSFTTQQLKLQSGDLDAMLHGVPTANLSQFENNSKFQVQEFSSIVRLNMWVNPHLPPFDNQQVRTALASAINRAPVISQVYGERATVAKEMFTANALPAGMGAFDPKYDPSQLQKLVPSLPTKKVDLAYTTDDPANQQVAELIQTQLSALGLQVTTRGVTEEQTFAWPTKPQGRSNLLILPANPDDADPSAWPTLFYAQHGGLSYFTPDNVPADDLVTQAQHQVDKSKATQLYSQAADMYKASGDYIPLADVKETAVARAGITGWVHDFSTIWTVRLQFLKAG